MPKSVAAVGHEAVELDEAALVQQQLDPLPRGQLALRVLLLDAFLAAAQTGAVLHLAQAGDFVLMGHVALQMVTSDVSMPCRPQTRYARRAFPTMHHHDPRHQRAADQQHARVEPELVGEQADERVAPVEGPRARREKDVVERDKEGVPARAARTGSARAAGRWSAARRRRWPRSPRPGRGAGPAGRIRPTTHDPAPAIARTRHNRSISRLTSIMCWIS